MLEGYFADQPQRRTYVQIEEARSSLILEAGGHGASEEQADLPPAHTQALLAVSQSQVEYVRTRLFIGSHEIQALHFVRPGPLDLVAVTNPPEDEQDLLRCPGLGRRSALSLPTSAGAWRSMVLRRLPEVEFTNVALNSLLDLLEDRFTTWPPGRTRPEPDARQLSLQPRMLPSRSRDRGG